MAAPDGNRLYPVNNAAYSTSYGPGACSALSGLWIKAMHANRAAATGSLAGAVGTTAQVQALQHQYEIDTGPDDYANLLRPIGLTCLARGRAPLERKDMRALMHMAFEQFGTYYLALQLNDHLSDAGSQAGGDERTTQHNLAFSTGVKGYYFFDPNFGLYQSSGINGFVMNADFLYDQYRLDYEDVEWFHCAPVTA